MKRFINVLLGTLLVATVLSFTNTNEVSAAQKSKVSYSLKKGVLTIKGKGNMPKKMTFKNNKKIKKVVIKNGIKSISKNAFQNCKNLRSVKFGKNVKVINANAFYNCKSLKKINLNNGKISKIDDKAFYNTSIKKVKIPNTVKKLGYNVFYNSAGMDEVSVPGKFEFDSAFFNKFGLVNVGDHIAVVKNVKNVKFKTNVDIKVLDYFDTENFEVSKNDSNYTSEDGIIYSSNKELLVRIPNREKLNISSSCKVVDLRTIFYATYIGDGFYDMKCDKVKEIYIPKSVEVIVNSCKVDNYDFSKSLERIEFEDKENSMDMILKISDFCKENYIITEENSILIFMTKEI